MDPGKRGGSPTDVGLPVSVEVLLLAAVAARRDDCWRRGTNAD